MKKKKIKKLNKEELLNAVYSVLGKGYATREIVDKVNEIIDHLNKSNVKKS